MMPDVLASPLSLALHGSEGNSKRCLVDSLSDIGDCAQAHAPCYQYVLRRPWHGALERHSSQNSVWTAVHSRDRFEALSYHMYLAQAESLPARELPASCLGPAGFRGIAPVKFHVLRRILALEELPAGTTCKLQRTGLTERLGLTSVGWASVRRRLTYPPRKSPPRAAWPSFGVRFSSCRTLARSSSSRLPARTRCWRRS